MGPILQLLADLVPFTEKILNGKLRFLCTVCDDLENIMKTS